MLKRFEVKNYKNFCENIVVDFSKVGGYQFSTECIANQMLGKILIYGRNATGKTNLGRAFLDITSNLSGIRYLRTQTGIYMNADSAEKTSEFKYVFQFGEKEVIYHYRKYSENQIYDEELYLNNQKIFYYNFQTKENDFNHLDLLDADKIVTDRYLQAEDGNEGKEEGELQTLSFLRWLINNTALHNDSVLLKMDDYIKRMTMLTVGSGEIIRPRRAYDSFFEALENNDTLKDFEDFLNAMGVACELVLKQLPDGQKELYFKHENLVPFYETASSGTIALMNLYRRLELGKGLTFLYIDEFDAFYHYEMSENVIKFFKAKYPECQVIMTTHNTNLMTNRLMRPDSLFILSRKGRITALCDATQRELREGHNLEKLYISGEFEKYE